MKKSILFLAIFLFAGKSLSADWVGMPFRISLNGETNYQVNKLDYKLTIHQLDSNTWILNQFGGTYILTKHNDGILSTFDYSIVMVTAESQRHMFEEYIYSRKLGKFDSVGVWGIFDK